MKSTIPVWEADCDVSVALAWIQSGTRRDLEQSVEFFFIRSLLFCPGDELEYLRPNVYRNVARQLNITVASESIVSDAFLAVAADIFSTGGPTSQLL